MADGDLVKVDNEEEAAGKASPADAGMNKFLESALIALDAIWAAKLRSFMTVLGNIVAVTSIIAVVSLIQGLNASVKEAILNQAGADSFNIQQFPITRSDEEFEKVRGNPRITLDDARAIRRYGSDLVAGGDGRFDGARARSPTATSRSTDVQVRGVIAEYVNFSSFDAERGRLMSPTEVESARPVAVVGWQTADRLFGADIDPLEKTIQIEGVHFRVVGVSAKRGSLLGQSQDEFAVIPLGQFQMLFGSRRSLSLTRASRATSRRSRRRWTRRRSRCGAARRLKPKQPRQLRHLHLGHDSRHLPLGDQRHLRGARRRRRAVAGGRRHRHHEHHADGGDRADAGDRAAQGARRAALRHHGADADRVGGAVDLRRRHRHDARRRRSR